MTDLPHPTRAEIDLGAIRHNARTLLALAGPAEVLGVVKANAYGHGAVPVTRALQEEGIEQFAVATVPEGIELREAGIEAPILVFAAPLPDALPAYARHALAVTVSSREVAESVAAYAATTGPLRAHVQVDTGMHRLGLRPDELPDTLRFLADAPGVEVDAVWTHFATADGDLGYARQQHEDFWALVDQLGSLRPPHVHASNGPFLLRCPEDAARPGTLVRCGGVLYGLASSRELRPSLQSAGLRPAVRLTTRVVHLQTVQAGESVSYGRLWIAPEPRRIATLPVGYADGLPRALTNRGHVGLHGRLFPIAGRVCMDMLMVDLGPPEGIAATVSLGDEAVLFGAGGPDLQDQAEAADTMPYELTCALSPRVPRVS